MYRRVNWNFVKRQRTPQLGMKLGMQLQLAGLSLSNIASGSRRVGCRAFSNAIHDLVNNADFQVTDSRSPNHVAVDKTVITITIQQFRLYAAADPDTNGLLHLQLFVTNSRRCNTCTDRSRQRIFREVPARETHLLFNASIWPWQMDQTLGRHNPTLVSITYSQKIRRMRRLLRNNLS